MEQGNMKTIGQVSKPVGTERRCDFCEHEHTDCKKLINEDWSTRCVLVE